MVLAGDISSIRRTELSFSRWNTLTSLVVVEGKQLEMWWWRRGKQQKSGGGGGGGGGENQKKCGGGDG